MRRSTRSLVAGLVLGSLALPGVAEEVGVALRVHKEVLGHDVGKPEREIRQNDPIERGLQVFLRGRDPYLRVALNFGDCQVILKGAQNHRFTGTASFAGVSEFDFGDPKDPSASQIKLTSGKMRFAGPYGADCNVHVDTPSALLIMGALVRVLVLPVLGTFVGVDQGSATVQAKAGGAAVVVKAGSWVLVPPGGLPTRPTPLPPDDGDDILQDPPLLGCCSGTEPPKPPGHSAGQGRP